MSEPRLLLRPWQESDYEPFADLCADPVVMEHFPSTMERAAAIEWARLKQSEIDARGWGLWAAEVRGVANFIGFIGLSRPSFMPDSVEIGWRLAQPFWGFGYATEGANLALDYGFTNVGLGEIVSFTATTNVRSEAVMRRLGMTHDAADDFDHPNLPAGHRLARHVLYRMSRERWTSLRG